MIINIGGEVSPSFLCIFATFFFWQKYLDFKKDKILKKFLCLFGIILVIQIIWIPFAETDVFTQIKGISVTISGLLFFMYYYMVYRCNPNVVKWAVLGTFLSSFVFINVLAEVAGGEFGLWKFQIMPRIVTFAILIYLWTINNKHIRKSAPFLLIFVGGLGLVTGARSCGLVPFMAGAIGLLVQRERINVRNLKKYAIAGGVTLYTAYALLYVPNVLNGNITGGNTEQLKEVKNAYNPIALLLMGRTDSVVPFMAFLDNPFTGWGYFAIDPNFKYHLLKNKLKTGDSEDGYEQKAGFTYQIPGHSVWGYYSCSYGIIVFIALFMMLRNTWGFVYRSLVCRDKYLLYRIYALLGLTWNFLFSPMAHFKTLPSSMAVVIALSFFASVNHKNQ